MAGVLIDPVPDGSSLQDQLPVAGLRR
jgi:hypothetical protein